MGEIFVFQTVDELFKGYSVVFLERFFGKLNVAEFDCDVCGGVCNLLIFAVCRFLIRAVDKIVSLTGVGFVCRDLDVMDAVRIGLTVSHDEDTDADTAEFCAACDHGHVAVFDLTDDDGCAEFGQFKFHSLGFAHGFAVFVKDLLHRVALREDFVKSDFLSGSVHFDVGGKPACLVVRGDKAFRKFHHVLIHIEHESVRTFEFGLIVLRRARVYILIRSVDERELSAGVCKLFQSSVGVLFKVFFVDTRSIVFQYVEEAAFFRFYEEVIADVIVIKREFAVFINVFIDVSLIQVFLSDGICQRICVLQNRIIGVRVVSVVFIARCARIVFDIIVHIADKHADKEFHNARHYLNLQAFVAKENYGVEFGQVDVRRRRAVALVDKPFKEPDKVEFQRDGLNNRAAFRFEIQRCGFLVIVKTKEDFTVRFFIFRFFPDFDENTGVVLVGLAGNVDIRNDVEGQAALDFVLDVDCRAKREVCDKRAQQVFKNVSFVVKRDVDFRAESEIYVAAVQKILIFVFQNITFAKCGKVALTDRKHDVSEAESETERRIVALLNAYVCFQPEFRQVKSVVFQRNRGAAV